MLHRNFLTQPPQLLGHPVHLFLHGAHIHSAADSDLAHRAAGHQLAGVVQEVPQDAQLALPAVPPGQQVGQGDPIHQRAAVGTVDAGDQRLQPGVVLLQLLEQVLGVLGGGLPLLDLGVVVQAGLPPGDAGLGPPALGQGGG